MIKSGTKLIIAIDGYSSCGKSTVAKDLAKLLNIVFIDSGAMYRCVTLYAIKNKLVTENSIKQEELKEALNSIKIDFKFDANAKLNETYLNGEFVEKEIRSIEVSNLVSKISALAFVRKKLVEWQQEMGNETSIVMDGRDIGTVVFPMADLKLFMTASPEVRAERRYQEYQQKNVEITFQDVLENVKSRDLLDETREESPLRKADDAIVLDNTHLNKEEQLNFIIAQLKERQLIK